MEVLVTFLQLSAAFPHPLRYDTLTFRLATHKLWSRDSSIGIATDWTIGVRFPAKAGNFSLRHRDQIGSGAHPASYPMGARVLSLGI
jgi:hypothetical protein